MAITKEERLQRIHDEAMREFDKIQSAVRDERLQCLQDRRFYSIAGAQWEGPLGVQFENKPRYEVNKIHLAVIRIFNEYRNNRIDVSFVSKEGEEYDDLADTCASLFRADEQDSTAEEAYDNAFEEAVGGGFGAFRLRAVYEDEEDDDDERQRIRIEPIFDADSSVFFNLDAKRYDKADATSCYVLTSMSIDAYKSEYDDDPASWPKIVFQRQFDWLTPDVVYIAEYYKVENYKETIVKFEGLAGAEEKKHTEAELRDDPQIEADLLALGYKESSRKTVKKKRVHKYILSGNKVLEDCGIIAGKNIPIVPVYGKRWFIDNVERCMGHVRLAKDSQRLKNMQLSKLAEISALSTVEKPIFAPEQIAGHQMMWAQDNIKNYPYLLVNPLVDQNGNPTALGPTAYTKAPNIPPGLAGLLQLTEQDMNDLLGNQQAADQLVSNISGKAVEMVQQRLDMQSYIYVSNMAKSIKRCGQIWLGMAKELFVEEGRKMKGIGERDEVKTIELMRPVIGENGEATTENDLSDADFDIAVTVGPTSDSKRQATVRALTGMMTITQDPETLQVMSSMAMMNMEGEGIKDVRNFFRKKMVTMGVIPPTEEEAQEMAMQAQNLQPDAQTLYLQAAAQEAQSKAVKAQADTVLTAAKAEETKANTADIISKMTIDEQKHFLEILQQAQGTVQESQQ